MTSVGAPLTLYGEQFNSRFLIGSALYPSPAVMNDAVNASGAEIITLSLRRQLSGQSSGAPVEQQQANDVWQYIQKMGLKLLPNTAGCKSATEAITLDPKDKDTDVSAPPKPSSKFCLI